ncbi:MAG: site-specific integrase [Muribaculaceae bacterium]|nr:site-specific integrase [Muribaculaceae bacterium]
MYTKIQYRAVFNRAHRLDKHGKALVQIEMLQHGSRIYFTTHIHIEPKQWNQGVVVDHPMADEYNFVINDYKSRLERIEIDYIKRGIYPSLDTMRRAIREAAAPSSTFIDFARSIVTASERKARTIAGYETLFNNLEKFRHGVLLTDIDYDLINRYDRWMHLSGIAHNTRVGRLRQVKAILNEAYKRDIIAKNPFDLFKIPPMNSKKGFLTTKQLNKIENLVVSGPVATVRDAFLFCCYTGLRFSDLVTLRSSEIAKGWITKKMVKTNFTVEIPASEVFDGKAIAIIDRYGSIERLTRKLGTNATVNKNLKAIFQKAKIEGKFTFHTSRHTFATLMLQMGVPITSVQKMLGHQKLATTQIYGEVDKRTIASDIKKVLRKSRKSKGSNDLQA